MADKLKDGIIGNNHGIVTAGKPYIGLIERMSIKYGIPEVLISHQMKHESNFRPYAVSSKGAVGIMQIMPETAKALSVRHGLPAGPLEDPEVNADLGVAYMRELYDIARRFTNNPESAYRAALVGYFAGPARISSILVSGEPMRTIEANYVENIVWDFEKTESWEQITPPQHVRPTKRAASLWPILLIVGGVYIWKKIK